MTCLGRVTRHGAELPHGGADLDHHAIVHVAQEGDLPCDVAGRGSELAAGAGALASEDVRPPPPPPPPRSQRPPATNRRLLRLAAIGSILPYYNSNSQHRLS